MCVSACVWCVCVSLCHSCFNVILFLPSLAGFGRPPPGPFSGGIRMHPFNFPPRHPNDRRISAPAMPFMNQRYPGRHHSSPSPHLMYRSPPPPRAFGSSPPPSSYHHPQPPGVFCTPPPRVFCSPLPPGFIGPPYPRGK